MTRRKIKLRGTGVYSIRNVANGKLYIGSSANSLSSRMAEHKRQLGLGTHYNRYLQRAWNKYGSRSFEFSIIERCEPKRCVASEQAWIDKMKASKEKFGYNISPTAASTLGTKLSKETRRRISESKKGVGLGRKMSTEAKRKISKALVGNKNGVGHTYKMSQAERKRRTIDITGQKFGRLTVTKFYDTKPHARWVCLCDCGNTTVTLANSLKNGRIKSCGCLLAEILLERNSTVLAGENHHKSKLTLKTVKRCRRRYVKFCEKNGMKALAAEFGVHENTMRSAIYRRTWK